MHDELFVLSGGEKIIHTTTRCTSSDSGNIFVSEICTWRSRCARARSDLSFESRNGDFRFFSVLGDARDVSEMQMQAREVRLVQIERGKGSFS